jgi:seryl-tRNA synthetase
MLDIKWIRENPDALDRALRNRNAAPAAQRLIALDEARRKHIAELQKAQEQRNAASKEIGKAKATGDEARAQALIDEVARLKVFLPQAEAEEKRFEGELRSELAMIPNVPAADVPVGKDEQANVELRRDGKPRRADGFEPKEHFELGEQLGMDFETAAKLSGARFVVLKGQLARLERALGQFMLDIHTGEHGYTEVQPPLVVRPEVLHGTGQMPKFLEDLFLATTLMDQDKFWAEYDEARDAQSAQMRYEEVPTANWATEALKRQREWVRKAYSVGEHARSLWLIPTAEVPLTNLVRESIVAEEELPLRYTALTPCFRSEAGAAGQDTRGMMRQHQFDKVELVSIATPDQAEGEHERMLACAEEVMKRLGLHYRVMTLSTGDMGFSAEKTWDIEVWLPGQGRFREISSVSRCGDFQARRMEARYRDSGGKIRHVHTLNGSGVAVGRALIAVMETYQNADGSVTIPSVLAPYMGGIEKIGP